MSDFEHGDDTLIEGLIKSKVPMAEIAEKFDVTEDKLRTYCKRKGISMPRKAPASNGCHQKRLAAEKGLHKSPTVNNIIKMHGRKKTVEQIAESVGKTKQYVQRMVDVFCEKDSAARHKRRYKAVSEFSKEFKVPLRDAARMLGTSYTAYQYSAKVLGLMK